VLRHRDDFAAGLPGCRELAGFETQIGCSLPDYHEALDYKPGD